MGGITEVERVYKQYHMLSKELQNVWVEHILFTGSWWAAVGLTIIPWILWWKFRNKESTMRCLTVGFFIMVIASWSDSMGIQLGFWHYHYEVVPFIPAAIPWDISVLPVFVMFLLQIKNMRNPLIKALVFASVSAFIGEPFAVWINLYDPTKWKYIYSFPIYIVLFLISHYIYSRTSFQK